MTITFVKKMSPAIYPNKSATAYAEQFKVVATKTTTVLKALLAGERLTVRYAALELHIFCLASLISHLRHHQNIPLQTQIIKKVESGLITRYGEYFLTTSAIAEIKAKSVLQ